MESDYKIRLEVFEGPLDLLLFLVRKDEIDIYDVSLELITNQFLAYIDAAVELDLELAGEFFVMAATLIYIKSRELLPLDLQPPGAEEDEDESDPRWELIRQLIEYKKYKDAAGELHQRELKQEGVFPRRSPVPVEALKPPPLGAVSIADLLKAFDKVLDRVRKATEIRDVVDENHTVADKIRFIAGAVSGSRTLDFADLFRPEASRVEMVVTFLALLELVRMKQILAEQLTPLGQIVLRRNPAARPLTFDENGAPQITFDSEEHEDAPPQSFTPSQLTLLSATEELVS